MQLAETAAEEPAYCFDRQAEKSMIRCAFKSQHIRSNTFHHFELWYGTAATGALATNTDTLACLINLIEIISIIAENCFECARNWTLLLGVLWRQ
jgi:hypothetical protein